MHLTRTETHPTFGGTHLKNSRNCERRNSDCFPVPYIYQLFRTTKGSVSAEAAQKLPIPINMRNGSPICVGKIVSVTGHAAGVIGRIRPVRSFMAVK